MVQVLYVLDSLRQRSGITAVAMNYFRAMDKTKVHIDFLVLEDSEKTLVDEIRNSGSNVYFMPSLSIRRIYRFWVYINKFFEEHRGYVAVHSHFYQIDALIYPAAKRNGIKNCISHSHNTEYSDYKIKAIRNKVMSLPIKYEATVWGACGIKAGRFLYGKKFLDSPKHLIINNAVDTQEFLYNPSIRREVREKLNLGNEILLGTIGRMMPQKNQGFLIKVFADLLKQDADRTYKLMVVGDGDLRPEIIKSARESGVSDKIIFMGQRNDVNRLLQAMDLFLLPSLYEGLPVVGIEAQASGLPCIFSSTITKEIDICNSIFLDIDKGTKPWVDAIKSKAGFTRHDTSEIIVKNNFDIGKEADKLCWLYIHLQ